MTGQYFQRAARIAAAGLVVCLVVLLFGQTADARVRRRSFRSGRVSYSQEGLALSVGLDRTGFDTELSNLENRRTGNGLALSLSFGLSDRLTLFGSVSGNGYESDYLADWSTGYIDVGLKFSFVSAYHSRTQPYLSASLGGAVLDHEDDQNREYLGGSARLAGGLDHFLSPGTLLFIEAGIRGGSYERMHLNDNTYYLHDEPEFNAIDLMFGLRFKL